ncbi:MAG TPA: hypothetical protein VF033_08340 [Steroidobacteraceae bacterium]|jgi:hypothetical protein
MRPYLLAVCAALPLSSVAASAAGAREDVFFALVKERHIPPVSADSWGRHIGDDCVWIGRGLRVVSRAEVQGLQVDTGKRLEIQDFVAHDYGHAAVLTYLVIEHQPQATGEVTTRLRKMDTYVERAEGWQLVANAEVVGNPDRKPVKLDAASLDRIAGSYETRFGDQVIRTRVWREASRLFAQTEGQDKSELMPLGATLFFDATEPEEGGAENEFVIDAQGRVTEWIYRDGDTEFRSRRLP